MILFDSNLLVYAHATHSPFHATAKQLRDQAARGELEACLAPQVLCEFFAVVTNPRLFDPPMTPKQASQEITTYWTQSGFRRIAPTEQTVTRLIGLVARHAVRDRWIFDVFLVATMLENGVTTIYTANTKDFLPFHELQVVNPFEPSSSSSTSPQGGRSSRTRK